MKALFLWSALFSAWLSVSAFAAEEPAPKPTDAPVLVSKPTTEERIRARLLEHTKLKAAAKNPPAKPEISPLAATATTPSPAPVSAEKTAAEAAEKAKAEPAAVMQRVEVNKSRVTVLDHQLQEQDREIEHEKKLTKSTDLDRALNGPKTSVSILGGESTKFRTTVASERVEMMEAEKDVIEAIAHAKTKEEKAELQKELVELKAMRRDLEKSLR